jgi:hypothetical protein
MLSQARKVNWLARKAASSNVGAGLRLRGAAVAFVPPLPSERGIASSALPQTLAIPSGLRRRRARETFVPFFVVAFFIGMLEIPASGLNIS